MKARHAILALCLLVAAGFGYSCGNSSNQDADRQALEQLVDQYCESINTCDTNIVSRIWAHDTYVSFIAPSGYYPSYEAIRDSFVTRVFGNNFSQRKLQKDDLKLFVNGNSAWSEFAWVFNATRNDGRPHNTKGFETQVYQKGTDGQWRLVHIHYSARRN